MDQEPAEKRSKRMLRKIISGGQVGADMAAKNRCSNHMA